jgi:hypothetical protein
MQMKKNKALEPDGFLTEFYQTFWMWCYDLPGLIACGYSNTKTDKLVQFFLQSFRWEVEWPIDTSHDDE